MKEESPQYLRRLNAALALREVPDYAAAMVQLREAEKEAPRDAQVHLLLGLTHQDLGDHDAAEESLRLALGYDPDWEPGREALAALLYSRGRYSEVLRLLKTPIEHGLAGPELWYIYTSASLGQLRLQWEENEEASRDASLTFELLRAKAEHSGSEGSDVQTRLVRLYQALAEHYLKDGVAKPEAALQAVDTGLEILPRHLQLLRLRVDALLRIARFADALELIAALKEERVTGLAPNEYVALLGIGDRQAARPIAYSYGKDYDGELIDAPYLLSEQGFGEAAATAAFHQFEFAYLDPNELVPLLHFLAEGGGSLKAEETLRYIIRRTVGPTSEANEVTLDYHWVENLAAELADWYEEKELAFLLHALLAYSLLWKGVYEEAASEYATIVARLSDGTYPTTGEEFPAVTCYNGQIVKLLSVDFIAEYSGPQVMQVNLAAAYCLAGELDKAQAEAEAAAAQADNRFAFCLAHAVLGCVYRAAGNFEAARSVWQKGIDVLDEALVTDERRMIRLMKKWLAELDDEAPENSFSG